MTEQHQITMFRQAIEPFLGDWRSIDLRVIAEHDGGGNWRFDTVRAILDHQPVGVPTRNDLPSLSGLLVDHQRWEMTRLRELTDAISGGEFKLGNETIIVRRSDGQLLSSPDYRFWERGQTRSEFGIDYASFILRGSDYGQHNQETIEHHRIIDAGLRSGKPPWDGLADLRRNFIGFTRDIHFDANARYLEVIAPIGIRLGESKLDGSSLLVIANQAPTVDTKHVTLSVIASFSNGSTVRESHTPVPSDARLATSAHFTSAPSAVRLIAAYRGVDVDRVEFPSAKNPQLDVLKAFGADTDSILSFLADARGQILEEWYSIVLQLLGFSPLHLGGTKLDAPDIVAFPDARNWLLVVECTGAEPDLGYKLTKLSTRTKKIRESIEGVEAYPVLMTSMRRSLVSDTDLKKAKDEGIAILTMDEAPDLLRMVREESPPEKFRSYLLTRVQVSPF